ncbi:unnamed protein product [Urochloa decumbens]|uniref:Uncharacterized protein n=1 Tax=Urochloa decumbens TaxID=240449 RepID=A0ABC8XE23_9POAL
MQRLSLGSSGGRPSRLSAAAAEEEAAGPGAADEKAAKAVTRGPSAAPDRSIHLVPVLTLLCFLVLFLLSHDPSAAALTDSPVLAAAATTVTARSLDAAAVAAGAGGCPEDLLRRRHCATRGFRGLGLSTSHASPLSLAVWMFAGEATTAASSGVYRRLKQSRVRRLGMARRRL